MELSFLRAMYEIPGPWASVYIDSTDHTEATAAALKLRWRAARETLLDEGIDEPTLLALEGALAQYRRPRHRHGLAVFAAQGRVHYAEAMPEPLCTDSAEMAPLPHVTPLLASREVERPPAGAAAPDASGVADTLAAFEQRQVEALLLDPVALAKSRVWIGDAPGDLSSSEERLRQLGANQAHPVRAEDALVRAAVLNDAELIIVNSTEVGLDEGVGAVLRNTSPTT
ncbi:hypothetical protein [Catellatospora sp. NPDC049609]|uniref:hypothetical protein n=1 Tax=Catellatospora sp. NPDC049609 TaxID=3155505 RepID=UPI003433B75F